MILDNRVVLVTGGTGSFGRAFTKEALKSGLKKLIIFSRDELKQSEMWQEFTDERLRFFIGDVRSRDRLYRALEGVSTVIHAAAMKQVPACEYNPEEAIETNIGGARNVINAAIDRGVERVLALSTDKAVNPINLYGATKLCSDKLFVAAASYGGGHQTKFALVRYGNVVGSRGSVVPLFQRFQQEGRAFPITDPEMTRFWITLPQAVQFTLDSLARMEGGEIFVPKIPAMNILDLKNAIDPYGAVDYVGMRPGEKLHELLISPDEPYVKEYDGYYAVLPQHEDGCVHRDFQFRSDSADRLSVEDIELSLALTQPASSGI